ncbi:MAG: hypothetical protein ISS62_11735 [Desulfobacteraceae bacterium]|nr:hypothetical protein [Desulfobacteraceae bacterium]
MEKQDLKGNNAIDNLKDLWDEKSDFLNNVADDALPELDRWNNELKELLSDGERSPENQAVRPEPVVELKAVEPKHEPPVVEEKVAEPPRKRDHTVRDKDLVLLIKKYKQASIVCDVTGMTLQMLRNRVGHLSYKLKTYIDVEGLYRDTYPVKLKSNGIRITTGHLGETDFKLDDRFKIDFKDKYIILTRLPRS